MLRAYKETLALVRTLINVTIFNMGVTTNVTIKIPTQLKL
jgi:hypothetical protein